jgi:hypothetical protein
VKRFWMKVRVWAHEKTAASPLLRLAVHFVNRSLRGGADSDSEELDFTTGLLLMLLPVPGTFISIIFYEKYSTFLQILRKDLIADAYAASLGDEYLFVAIAMALTGAVAVWRWDSIFLDRRDFANLAHLPVSAGRLFLANVVAILVLTMLFAFEVNVGSAILFPMIVSSAYPDVSIYAGFAVGHMAGVVLASTFTFVAVVACIGLLMFSLPYRLFRRASQYLRIALLLVFLALLMTTFAVGPLTHTLGQAQGAWLRFLPPVWFVSLCEWLRHPAPPIYEQVAKLGVMSLVGAVAFAGLACALSYKRCFLAIPETVETATSKKGFILPLLLRVANRLYLPTPARRASFSFVLRTLTRSEKHFTTLGAFAGMGLLLCAQTLMDTSGMTAPASRVPSAEILSVPLILIYCVVVGLRFTFEVPADLRANWIFKLQIDTTAGEGVALGRALTWTCLAPLLVLVCLPAYTWGWGWQVAIFHLAYLTVMAALLVETMIMRLRKIPFTCSLPLFKEHAFVLLFLLGLGFYAFVKAGSFLEHFAFGNPLRVILPVFVLAGWWVALHQYRSNLLEMDREIVFEEKPTEAVQLLNLETRL